MDYIYKIDVDCSMFDGMYEWKLWRRKKTDSTDNWAICAAGNTNTPEEAFDQAHQHERIYANKESVVVL